MNTVEHVWRIKRLSVHAPGSIEWCREYACDFNPEGEKQMEKIDWHKPLQARNPVTNRVQTEKVYTYKSGKQRVVWIDDRVYPVDDNGCMMAYVDYSRLTGRRTGVSFGQKIVENVPGEFFLGLCREKDGTYFVTDGGHMTTKDILEGWTDYVRHLPHWIVDTRQPAKVPEPIKHDPKDWTTVHVLTTGHTWSAGLMTESQAKEQAATPGGVGVIARVRTTPAPVDTARYIQLYRTTPGVGLWKIDSRPSNSPTQEYRREDTRKNGYVGIEYVHVQVRD